MQPVRLQLKYWFGVAASSNGTAAANRNGSIPFL